MPQQACSTFHVEQETSEKKISDMKFITHNEYEYEYEYE
jgi:hypothetical protein